jgi:hypothetical protein
MTKKFSYQGLTFIPVRKFKNYEDFPYISKRLACIGIHNYDDREKLAGWDYEEFYKLAIASDPICDNVDIFLWVEKGINVVPCKRELFEYETD